MKKTIALLLCWSVLLCSCGTSMPDEGASGISQENILTELSASEETSIELPAPDSHEAEQAEESSSTDIPETTPEAREPSVSQSSETIIESTETDTTGFVKATTLPETTDNAEAPTASQEPAAQESAVRESSSTGQSDGSNFNLYDNEEQQQTTDTYVLNKNTKKIHKPSCASVKKIAPKNYSTSSLSLSDLTEQGYSTCKNCFK